MLSREDLALDLEHGEPVDLCGCGALGQFIRRARACRFSQGVPDTQSQMH